MNEKEKKATEHGGTCAACRRQRERQEDLCDFEASLVYTRGFQAS